MTPQEFYNVLPKAEADAIERAALAMHAKSPVWAEVNRRQAGYGGLGWT